MIEKSPFFSPTVILKPTMFLTHAAHSKLDSWFN